MGPYINQAVLPNTATRHTHTHTPADIDGKGGKILTFHTVI